MIKVMATRFIDVQVFEDPPYSVRDLVQADYISVTQGNALS